MAHHYNIIDSRQNQKPISVQQILHTNTHSKASLGLDQPQEAGELFPSFVRGDSVGIRGPCDVDY